MTNWQEGDSLSPTNLNSRVPSWASSSANTGFIIPSNISGIGAPIINVKTEYGAVGDGIADDTTAIQAALNSAASATNIGGLRHLYFPAGRYNVSKPLVIQSTNISLEGYSPVVNATAGISEIQGTFAGGPIILGCGTSTVTGLTTALATGTGQAWSPPSPTLYWFNLRDLDTCDLNGLAAFTAECFYKSTANAITFIGSGGNWLLNNTANNCFSLGKTDAAATARFHLQTSNTTVNIAGGTVNDGLVHHVAGTYDGATARLFVDGSLVASTAATGTLVQSAEEDVTLGTLPQRTPDATNFHSLLGTYDSVRLSNTARYTAAFPAPTAKFSNDSNTLALLNFDDTIGTAVKAYNKNGTCWLQQRAKTASIAGPGALFVERLTIRSSTAGRLIGLLVGNEAYNWGAEALNFHGCRVGIYAPLGDVYGQAVRRVYMNANSAGRFGIVLGSNGFINHFDTVWLQGSQVGLFTMGTQAMTCTDLEIEGDTQTVFGAVVRNENTSNSPLVLTGCTFRTEGGVSSAYSAALAFGGVTLRTSGVVAHACTFETGNNAPFLIGDTVDAASFTGCNFVSQGSPPAVMLARGTFTRPVMFATCDQPGAWLPWSNVTGTAVVGQLGALSSTSTRGAINFDASVADVWDLTLTSDVTQSSWTKISYGQPLSGIIKMDSTGSRLFTWPVNSKGTVTLSYGSAAINTFDGFYDGVNVILTSVRTGL